MRVRPRAYERVARMICQSCITIRPAVEPDFVATGGLPVEVETAKLQLSNDFPVAEARKAAHLRSDYNRVVTTFTRARQVWNSIALTPGFDQFPSNITCDLQ